MAEEKVIALLLEQNHFFLIIGIFALIYLLRAITPLAEILFSDKWKWLIPIVNIALSAVGIFILGLTNAKTTSMKVIIMLIISAFTAYSYHLVKPVLKRIQKKFFKIADNTDG